MVLAVGAATIRAESAPPPPPDHWLGLLGRYVHGEDPFLIREHDGHLELLRHDEILRLVEDTPNAWHVAGENLPAHVHLEFSRDAHGFARHCRLGEREFQREFYGPETGRTFRITPVRPVEDLRRAARQAQPPAEKGAFIPADLVEVRTLEPSIRLDIRYATTDNFMGAAFYDEPRAFLQRPAAQALARVHRSLRPRGYGLLIFDAYRPWSVTKMFWDATPAAFKDFVADPIHGSRHNRGCAVDVTLVELATGQPVDMGGSFDEFSERSAPDYPGGTSRQRWHRCLLQRAMAAEGYSVYEHEWWHYDFQVWPRYAILNIAFREIAPADRQPAQEAPRPQPLPE
ncbi:MAG: M15 family metallopeptidase [Acidobacteria bacterium]|nr:M15 family metallopeptidase [Acidobacteriota bacterium]